MQAFSFEPTPIAGLMLIQPFIAEDSRGSLTKTFEQKLFAANGIPLQPYEEVTSVSSKGVLRGLHFQREHSQDKLVRVIHGAVYDVAVDLRLGSPTFGQWYGVYLSGKNHQMFYIPKGMAHGFLALEDHSVMHYLLGDQYHKDSEDGILWNDPQLKIEWPLHQVEQVLLNDKDQHHQSLASFIERWGGLSAEPSSTHHSQGQAKEES